MPPVQGVIPPVDAAPVKKGSEDSKDRYRKVDLGGGFATTNTVTMAVVDEKTLQTQDKTEGK